MSKKRKASRPALPALLLFFLLLAGLAVLLLLAPRDQGLPPRPPVPTHRAGAGGGEGQVVARLYFARTVDGQIRMAAVDRTLPAGLPPASAALEELIRGEVPPGCERPLPEGTKLLGVTAEGNTARADFSAELVKNFPGGSTNEGVVLYSIVNTLASLPNIQRVQILVEGRSVETIGGHLDAGRPLEPDNELLARDR